MSEKNGHKRRSRRSSEPPDSSFGRWLDLQPFWMLHARLHRELIGAGWTLVPSVDEDIPEFMRGRWRVWATGPSLTQPFSEIFLLHFATEQQCRDFRSDPQGHPLEVYELYSLEMLYGLLRCADPNVADEIDSYRWRSSQS